MIEKKANIKKLAVGRKDMFLLPIEALTLDHKWNERDRNRPEVKDHIDNIAQAILDGAQIPPLLVRAVGEKVLVRDGFCRYRAYEIAIKKGADIPGIPVLPVAQGTNDADDIAAMLARNNGLAFTFAEQARVVKRLLTAGWTKQEIALKTSKSITHVDNCIILLEANNSPAIMEMIDKGHVSMRLALETIRSKKDAAVSYLSAAIEKAKASGKKKATGRTANNQGKGEKKISWGKHGPEFFRLLEELERAYEALESVPDSIGDVVNWYRQYKDDKKITAAVTE